MLHTGGNNGRKELCICAGKSYISIRGDMHWEGLCTGKIYALERTTHWAIHWKKLHMERDKNKRELHITCREKLYKEIAKE